MNKDKVIDKLTTIFDLELSGVIRYTHYSLMIFGPNRLPLIDFFKAQASESLLHANLAGEHIPALEVTHLLTSIILKKHSSIVSLRYYQKH